MFLNLLVYLSTTVILAVFLNPELPICTVLAQGCLKQRTAGLAALDVSFLKDCIKGTKCGQHNYTEYESN